MIIHSPSNQPIIPGGFTVLMAVYWADNPVQFQRAVQSIFSNTLLPDAFQLVVDGPIPEDLQSMVMELKAKFGIDVLFLSKNMGLAHALNQGIARIHTTWIARADADDVNLSTRFETLSKYITQDIDIIGSAIKEVDQNGNFTGVRAPPFSQYDIYEYAKRRNPFNHMTVMYRSQLVKRFNGYPEIYLREDYALWATLLASGARAMNVSDQLVEVSAGKALIRRRGGSRYAFAEFYLQRHLRHYKFKGFWRALYDGMVRGMIFSLPSAIRSVIYKKYLRSPADAP